MLRARLRKTRMSRLCTIRFYLEADRNGSGFESFSSWPGLPRPLGQWAAFRAWEEKDFYIHCDVIVSTGDGDLQERQSVSLDPQWVLPLAKLALAMR